MHVFRQGGGVFHCAGRINQRGQTGGCFIRQHVVQTGGHIGVSDKPVARVIGQFGGLGFQMGTFRAERVQCGKVKMGQDFRHQNGGRALAVGWMFDQFIAFVLPADRIGVFAGGGGEIVQRVTAAHGLQRIHHVFGHFAPVKPVAAFGCDPAQNLGLTGGAKNLAGGQGGAIVQIVFSGYALQTFSIGSPIESGAGGDRYAGFGVMDSRGKRGFQPDFAPVFGQATKSTDCTGDGDGIGTAKGDGFVALVTQFLR